MHLQDEEEHNKHNLEGEEATVKSGFQVADHTGNEAHEEQEQLEAHEEDDEKHEEEDHDKDYQQLEEAEEQEQEHEQLEGVRRS